MGFDSFHEVETVSFVPIQPRKLRELRPELTRLGFTQYEDVYEFDRADEVPLWQTNSIASVEMCLKREEVYGLDGFWDELKLRYYLATLPEHYIRAFVKTVMDVGIALKLTPQYQGEAVTSERLLALLQTCAEAVRTEHGEAPGSEALAILIHSTYQRSRL